jgi:hypothetical protein
MNEIEQLKNKIEPKLSEILTGFVPFQELCFLL